MSTRTTLRCTVAFLAALLLSGYAHAQLFRAYLASDGNDANPCTLAQPCRLLPAALAAVAHGGEIWMLDSANYNTATVTIGKSVSILAIPGTVGSVVATGGPAISITAASLEVALRNLVLVPLPGAGGTEGVSMTGASSLTIEQSVIANLPSHGVLVDGTGAVKIADTIIRNNGGVAVGLLGGASATIATTQMLGNAAGGLIAYGTSAATMAASVADSVVSGGPQGYGLRAHSAIAGAVTRIFVTRSTIEGASLGLFCSTEGLGIAYVTVSYTTVTDNGRGWYIDGALAAIRSLGNNHIADNTNASVGSLTAAALQ